MKEKRFLKKCAAIFLTGILFAFAGCQTAVQDGTGTTSRKETPVSSASFKTSEQPGNSSIPESPVSSEPQKAVWDVGLLNGQTITQISGGGSVLLSEQGEVYIATSMVHLFGLEGSGATRVMRMRLEEPAKLVAQGNERFYAVGESNTIYYWGLPLTGDPSSETYFNDFSLKTIPFDKNIVDINVGSELCVVTEEGEAYTIGGGLLYGYGYASSTMPDMEISPKKLTEPIPVELPEKIKKMMAGSASFFAVGESGTLYYAPLIQEATVYSEEATKDLPHPFNSQVLQEVPLDFKVKDVRQFSEFIVLLSESGEIYTWNYMEGILDNSIGTKEMKLTFTKQPVNNIDTLIAGGSYDDLWGLLLQAKDGVLYRLARQAPTVLQAEKVEDMLSKVTVEKVPLPFTAAHAATTGQSVFVKDKSGVLYGFGNNRNGELLLEKYYDADTGDYSGGEEIASAMKPEAPVKLDLFYWEPEG